MPYFKFRRNVSQYVVIFVDEAAAGKFGEELEEFSELEYLVGLERGELAGDLVDIDYDEDRPWNYEGSANRYKGPLTLWERLTSKMPSKLLGSKKED